MKQHILLTIDDHDLFRAGIELIVKQNFPAIEVISAPSLGNAIDATGQEPDVVLLDYNLTGVSGAAALALCRSHWPRATIIVVTSEQDSAALEGVRQHRGVQVVAKSEPPQVLVDAIRAALPGVGAGPAPAPPPSLSPRQVEVLSYLRQGHSNKAIARIIGLSEFTVRGHVQHILKLVGATNRTNAVFLAEQAGLL